MNFLVVGPLRSVLYPSQPPVHENWRYSVWNRKSTCVPSSAKVKNEWRVTAISPCVFMARCTITGTITVACL